MNFDGSIEATVIENGTVYGLQCLSVDIDKLPVENVGPGTNCLVLDTGAIYVFHVKSKTWYQI